MPERKTPVIDSPKRLPEVVRAVETQTPEPAVREDPRPEPPRADATPTQAPVAADAALSRRGGGGPPSQGLDADGVREYKWALARNAERWKRGRPYPALARERGWIGRPEVRVEIPSDGGRPRVDVAKGTGYEVLDAYARDMFLAAAETTRVPETLRGKHFAITVPIRFTLEDEE